MTDSGASPGLGARPTTRLSSRLSELVAWLASDDDATVQVGPDVTVHGVSLATSRLQPGDLYAALRGTRAHGAQFIPQALEAGAVAVLTDPDGRDLVPEGVSAIVVAEPRKVLGRLAAHLHGEPATRMRMIGVTGTQGKTTTTRLLDQGLDVAEVPSAVIGTVGTRVLHRDVATSLTTPEAPDLHALFAMMSEVGVQVCAMEVSSHALVQGRVDGVIFDVATFLNLGRDHLDFHSDVEDYFAAKAMLFTPQHARTGLTNIDDVHGRRLLEVAGIPMQTFSTRDDARTGAQTAAQIRADWRAVDIEPGPDGSTFTVIGPQGVRVAARSPIAGAFNVSNTLAAIASAALAGLDPAVVAAGIAQACGVPGRLEPVANDHGFTVLVDYAHKPDALEAVLATLRPVTSGRIIVVIGAGGDRDTGKRPVMGEIAARLGDVVIVTDDNPRTEDPSSIRAAILAGTTDGRAEVHEIGRRREAIGAALRWAQPGDVVLIAGKGHETGQEVDGVVHPFDDREVAARALSELGDA